MHMPCTNGVKHMINLDLVTWHAMCCRDCTIGRITDTRERICLYMRSSIGWGAFLLAAAANVAIAGPGEPPDSAVLSQTQTRVQGGLPAPTGRLKFKSAGPVCICGEGLSERDIEKATPKFKSDKEAISKPGVSRSQEKPVNSGASK